MMKKCLYLFLILSVMFSGLTIQAYGLEDITIKKSQLGEEISISGDALPDTWVNLKITDEDGNIVYFYGLKTSENSPDYSFEILIPNEAKMPLNATLSWGDTVETAVIRLQAEGETGGGGGGGSGGGIIDEPEKPLEPEKPSDKIGSDVPKGHWAKNSIDRLIEKGIISGDRGTGNVRPESKITREEIAVLLLKAMELPMAGEGKINIGDNSSEWAKNFLKSAKDHGIMLGSGEGNMRGKDCATRMEVAVMIARAKKMEKGDDLILERFSDYKTIPAWARAEMATMVKSGYLAGYGDNTLRPANNITRAEAFALVSRIIE